MKKGILIILCLLLLLPGCQKQEETLQTPVPYFYLRREITYSNADGVLASEHREAAGHEQDYEYLLSQYLTGPKSQELYTLIPANTRLCSFAIQGESATVILSDQFADSTGINLTLNCACITKTCMALTGAKQVKIQCETATLGDTGSIVMDENTLILLDETGLAPAP